MHCDWVLFEGCVCCDFIVVDDSIITVKPRQLSTFRSMIRGVIVGEEVQTKVCFGRLSERRGDSNFPIILSNFILPTSLLIRISWQNVLTVIDLNDGTFQPLIVNCNDNSISCVIYGSKRCGVSNSIGCSVIYIVHLDLVRWTTTVICGTNFMVSVLVSIYVSVSSNGGDFNVSHFFCARQFWENC